MARRTWENAPVAAFMLLALAGCSQNHGSLTPSAAIEPFLSPGGKEASTPPQATVPTATGIFAGVPTDRDGRASLGTTAAAEETHSAPAQPSRQTLVWGVAGIRGYAIGQQSAPNGKEYDPLFTLDMNFNCWLSQAEGVYLFSDTQFWAQKAAPGVTNAKQGAFDFSKRELDLDLGVAWNYAGPWEARAFAYSYNNLNRGNSTVSPSGYADGVGLENRYYVGKTYADLGTESFDVARATFLTAGFYPTKDMVDGEGKAFKPGPFARAYLTWDLLGEWCYLYSDVTFIATQSFTPKMLQLDSGVAVRPFSEAPRVEFRLGAEGGYDLQWRDLDVGVYLSIRIVF